MSLGGGFVTSGGWLEVIAGSMFSGKTEELMRRVRRATIARKRVQVFKSHLDDRYAGVWAVSSHDRRTVEAVPVDSSAQILLRLDPMAQVIAIDEAELARRRAAWKPGRSERLAGVLEKYAKLVGPAHEGAVTHSGAVDWPRE